MYFSLILLPIISSIITGFLGRKIGKIGGQFISTGSIFITMLLSLIIFLEVGGNSISVYFNMFR
jgi:NADH-ubiquinone oxidoreductase chain 5